VPFELRKPAQHGICFRASGTGWRPPLNAAAGSLLLVLAACATPIQVERADPRAVESELTSNMISTGELSEPTQIVLHRQDLTERFASDPEAAITILHRIVTTGEPDPDALFALAEMSFRHAEDGGKQAYYLAAAVYAFAFLFPDDPAQRPDRFDPRLRIASTFTIGARPPVLPPPTARVSCCVRDGTRCRSAVSTSPTMRPPTAGASSRWWSSHRPTGCTSRGCRTAIASAGSGRRSRRMRQSQSRKTAYRSRRR
jgi:hypothetical protein